MKLDQGVSMPFRVLTVSSDIKWISYSKKATHSLVQLHTFMKLGQGVGRYCLSLSLTDLILVSCLKTLDTIGQRPVFLLGVTQHNYA